MYLHNPAQGALWIMAAGVAFAVINTTLQYLGIKHDINSGSAVLYQYGIALLVFLPALKKGVIRRAMRSDFRLLHILRVSVSVLGIQLWTLALTLENPVPIWQGIALLMTSPLFATIGSGLLLGETVSKVRWFATALGFIGAMLILAPWSDAFVWASLLPLGAAFFWASASLLTKFTVSRDSPSTIVFYLLVLMLPFDLIFGLPSLVVPKTWQPWILLIIIGALTALAQWAIAKAYSVADASFLQPFDHAKLPLNVLGGYLIFGWVPPGMLWIGSAMIIAAVALVTHHEHRRNPLAIWWEKQRAKST
ncbi:DMT family transporter [Suttonella ornithocola]|uniref:Carboxylate/amino acid/amine transporter n=1 Tax=Suttonella ornithocola TaxID=279832 RepID=A0A380MVK9_9GAMM|nr:DMT family transporter [Suttonella ornithocola]SUO96224.1 carboxylate/amino acid/amine transporter [Suttonella ornithocola]